MVVVLEMSSGKSLDEACSAFGEESAKRTCCVGWARPPRIEARLEEVVASPQVDQQPPALVATALHYGRRA